MRIGGLASGMDTEQTVKDLMRAERIPLDKMMQKKTTAEWQRDQYRELNTLMTKFRDNTFDTVMRRAIMASKNVSSSNENLVTATATAAASNGSFNISSVKQLAQAATTVSNRSLTADGANKIDPTKSIYFQDFQGSVTWEQGVIENETISVSEANSTFTLENANIVNDAGVTAAEAISVKVNGKTYEVITAEPTVDGQVKVDTTTGELTFFEPIATGSKITATYVNDTKTSTLSASSGSPRKEFSLGAGALVTADLSIKVGGTEYTDANGGIVTNKGDLAAGKVYVDLETGTVEFNESVSSNVEVTYAQNYMSSTMTTHNSDGKVKDQFFITGDKTLNQALKQVNDSNVGVSVFYDEFSDRVTMMREDTGKFNSTGEEILFSGDLFNNVLQLNRGVESEITNGNELTFKDNSGNLVAFEVKLDDGTSVRTSSSNPFTLGNNQIFEVDGKVVGQTDAAGNFTFLDSQGAQNAQFTINGLETERHSNTFTMNDVTFTLKDTFTTGNVSLSTSTDTENVFDTVVKFVNDYNEMIEKVNEKLTEERYRDYKPLTDEQKEAMSEKEIELWEERAKSGMLKGDNVLSSGMDRLRVNMYSPVETSDPNSTINQLTDLGITTTKNYMERGKLVIDESKLRAAVESDPEAVYQLFAADGETNAEKGVARRLRDSLQETMRSVSERAGGSFGKLQNHQFTLGRNINDIEDRISSFERRMQQVEDRYWKQFTAMEKAMQQANAQSANLMSMLNGGQPQQQ